MLQFDVFKGILQVAVFKGMLQVDVFKDMLQVYVFKGMFAGRSIQGHVAGDVFSKVGHVRFTTTPLKLLYDKQFRNFSRLKVFHLSIVYLSEIR